MESKPLYIVRIWENGKPHDCLIPDFYEQLEGLRAEIAQAERLTNDEIATAAVGIAKLETIRRLIMGRGSDIHPPNQCAIDDALFDEIIQIIQKGESQ